MKKKQPKRSARQRRKDLDKSILQELAALSTSLSHVASKVPEIAALSKSVADLKEQHESLDKLVGEICEEGNDVEALEERVKSLELARTTESRYRRETASARSDAHSYHECLKEIAAVIEGEISGVSARRQIAELLTRVGIVVERNGW